MTKTCKICKQKKDISKFRKGNSYKDGHNPRCNTCRYLTSNLDIRYSLSGRIKKWESNAKSKGLKWTIDEAYLLNIPQICFYTGQQLTLERCKFNTISLDRIDSKFGYIPNNVVFCCTDINRMKQEFNINHFYNLCKMVTKNKKAKLN